MLRRSGPSVAELEFDTLPAGDYFEGRLDGVLEI